MATLSAGPLEFFCSRRGTICPQSLARKPNVLPAAKLCHAEECDFFQGTLLKVQRNVRPQECRTRRPGAAFFSVRASSGDSSEEVPTLWYFPLSYAAIKARLALEEKRIEHKLHSINILTGKTVTLDYAKINPNFTVPSLQFKDRILTDSIDIIRWADSVGEPLGGDAVDRAKVDEIIKKQQAWDDSLYTVQVGSKSQEGLLSKFRLDVAEARAKEYADSEYADAFARRVQNVKKFNERLADPNSAAEQQQKLDDILDFAEAQLSEHPFAAGSEFSIGDVVLMTVLSRVDFVGKTEELLKGRAKVAEYWERMKTRESYQEVIGKYEGAGSIPILAKSVGKILLRNAFSVY